MNVEVGTEAARFPEKEYKIEFSLQCSFLFFILLKDYYFGQEAQQPADSNIMCSISSYARKR